MISVIVPVYNAEKYLECCINSILAQTYKDFELILVDDGSTDTSLKICEDYAQKYSNVFAIHKDNGGAVAACNAGLEAAKGDHICFIDSDDFISPDYLQCLYGSLEPDIDMVCMNCVRYIDDGKQYNYKINHWTSGVHVLDDEFYSEFLCWDAKSIANSRWGKLIKAEIVKKYAQYCSEEVTCGEDQQLIVGVLLGCSKVKVVDEYKYFYRCNPDSIMNSYKKDLWNRYRILVKTIAQIPEMQRVSNLEEQLNGKLLLSVCACIKNEFYYGHGLSKKQFSEFYDVAVDLNLFERSKISNIGRLHSKMIKYLRSKAYLRIKFLLSFNKLYGKFKNA
ncbi:MAG: glycosyltransferase [Roseburia sp.]|nr:glycosyltransferase [Roseburia sp.]